MMTATFTFLFKMLLKGKQGGKPKAYEMTNIDTTRFDSSRVQTTPEKDDADNNQPSIIEEANEDIDR